MSENIPLFIQKLQDLCVEHSMITQTQSSVTMEEHYNNYLKNLEGHGSPRAFADKVRLSKVILVELGHYKLHELDIDLLSRFINRLTTRTYIKGGVEQLYTQTYIDKVYTNLKCVLRLAVQKGLIYKNVLEEIPCPTTRKFDEDKEEAFTDTEIAMILSAFENKEMWHLMIMLLAYTGMRPGEVYALRFSDFDFEMSTVKVRRALSLNVNMDLDSKSSKSSHPYIKLLKNETHGKREYARRVLTLSEHVMELVKDFKYNTENSKNLYEMKKKNKTTDYLFTAPSDGLLKRPDYYCNEYRKQLVRKGIAPSVYNLYRFRHTYCTRLFKQQKLDPKTVQLLMGDNSIDMVMRVYHSVSKDDIIRASADFSHNMDFSLGLSPLSGGL